MLKNCEKKRWEVTKGFRNISFSVFGSAKMPWTNSSNKI